MPLEAGPKQPPQTPRRAEQRALRPWAAVAAVLLVVLLLRGALACAACQGACWPPTAAAADTVALAPYLTFLPLRNLLHPPICCRPAQLAA